MKLLMTIKYRNHTIEIRKDRRYKEAVFFPVVDQREYMDDQHNALTVELALGIATKIVHSLDRSAIGSCNFHTSE